MINELFENGCIKEGNFKLKSGEISKYYFDMKNIISYPTFTNAALSPVIVFFILAINISPTLNLLLSFSLCNSISFPSCRRAKSTAELIDRIIISLFTINSF